MSQFKTFKFTANTIDGKILEFPQIVNLRCDMVKPLGNEVIRQFNGNECIVAKKVYLVFYDGHVYGTTQFNSLDSFLLYRNANCKPFCKLPYFTLNNCFFTLGGCQIQFGSCTDQSLGTGGCGFTLAGCEIKL